MAGLSATLLATMPFAQQSAGTVAYRLTYEQNGVDSVAIELSWAAALSEPRRWSCRAPSRWVTVSNATTPSSADVRAFTSAHTRKRRGT